MISIIVPVYKVEHCVAKCIDSVLSQTYTDWELILVDDGSPDNSGVVCDEYAITDNRIIVVHQQNRGVSTARNVGIARASGDFVCFIDSDDSVQPYYLKCMVEALAISNADIVIQGLNNVRNCVSSVGEHFEPLYTSVNLLTQEQYDRMIFFCGPYCKLFRTDIIKKFNVQFPVDLAYGEDFVFYTSYLSHCRIIHFIAATQYNYSVAVEGSLSSKVLHPSKFWSNQINRRREYKHLMRIYGLKFSDFSMENSRKLSALYSIVGNMKAHDFKDEEIRDLVKEIIINQDFDFKAISPRNFKDFIVLFLFKINNKLSRYILCALI